MFFRLEHRSLCIFLFFWFCIVCSLVIIITITDEFYVVVCPPTDVLLFDSILLRRIGAQVCEVHLVVLQIADVRTTLVLEALPESIGRGNISCDRLGYRRLLGLRLGGDSGGNRSRSGGSRDAFGVALQKELRADNLGARVKSLLVEATLPRGFVLARIRLVLGVLRGATFAQFGPGRRLPSTLLLRKDHTVAICVVLASADKGIFCVKTPTSTTGRVDGLEARRVLTPVVGHLGGNNDRGNNDRGNNDRGSSGSGRSLSSHRLADLAHLLLLHRSNLIRFSDSDRLGSNRLGNRFSDRLWAELTKSIGDGGREGLTLAEAKDRLGKEGDGRDGNGHIGGRARRQEGRREYESYNGC